MLASIGQRLIELQPKANLVGNFARRMIGLEPRSATYLSKENFPKFLLGHESFSGIRINSEQAMRISAVYAAVGIISGAISSMPLILYRRTSDGGKERATDHPLWPVITSKPHRLWNFFEFMETEMQRLLLNGNSFSLKQPVGQRLELRPLEPSTVTVDVQGGEPIYIVRGQLGSDGIEQRYTREQVFHIKGISSDGYVGRSVISDAREAFGLSAVVAEHMARVFKNGAAHRGVIEFAQPLSEKARKNFKDSYKQEYEGSENTGKTLVIEGARFRTVSMSMTDAQTMEVAKFSISDIARIFQIPLHMLAENIAQPRANMEQSSKEFDKGTLLPWTRRIEFCYNDQIFNNDPDLFVEFLFEERLRTDLAARTEAYAKAKMNGWMNADTICARENLPFLPNGAGAVYWMPHNMQPVPGTVRQDQAALYQTQSPPPDEARRVNGVAH